MAYSFGDSFDLYALPADMVNGYWDGGTNPANFQVQPGRFTGSRALGTTNGVANAFKNSSANDAVHHIIIAINQQTAISGSALSGYLSLLDGATAQCTIVFRSDGAILLASGAYNGTVLATYTGAVTANLTWFAFEFEVVINNTTGSFTVRKNGNTSNDFTLGSLNTRPVSTNNYANRLQVGCNAGSISQYLDDVFWQSGSATGGWLGDIRCYTRMPASDTSAQFSRSPSSNIQSPVTASTTAAVAAGTARYTAFVAAYDGTIGTATVSLGTGYTGNLKATIFASSGSAPTTVLGSATIVVNPAAGLNTLPFGTPVAVTKGTRYWLGCDSDTASGTWSVAAGTTGLSSTTAYASFPAASPTTSAAAAVVCSLTIVVGTNNCLVNEAQEDAGVSYVYDSTISDADFYGLGSIASTPASTIAVVTRCYMQKSDAGSRTAAAQLKSGATTAATPTLTLSTSGWLWAWRTDMTDPNTGSAWTATAVNNAQIGPTVIS